MRCPLSSCLVLLAVVLWRHWFQCTCACIVVEYITCPGICSLVQHELNLHSLPDTPTPRRVQDRCRTGCLGVYGYEACGGVVETRLYVVVVPNVHRCSSYCPAHAHTLPRRRIPDPLNSVSTGAYLHPSYADTVTDTVLVDTHHLAPAGPVLKTDRLKHWLR